MITTATMTTTKMNSNRERERNWPSASSELSSVVGEPLIPSEPIGRVVDSCSVSEAPSLVFDSEVVGIVFVRKLSGVTVVEVSTVQEFPIDGSLCSAA
jgi:hypothetical protein